MKENVFVSPADSKLLVYKIDDETKMFIKGRDYTVAEVLDDETAAQKYKGGYALVFRLSVDDYHRYGFPDSGKVVSHKKIKGKLHTVSSISKDHKIYKENCREVSILETDNFGMVAYVEVGALLVGKIINHDVSVFEKGQEKGYFEPGGSTVIIFVGGIEIDEDILKQSAEGVETKIKYGERVGVLRC